MQKRKTKIDEKEVLRFLENYHSAKITNVIKLKSGELSTAFEYTFKNQSLILRVNKEMEPFQKDKVLSERLKTYNLPIPKIISIGNLDNKFYSISEKSAGKTLDLLSKEKNLFLLNQLFELLTSIHKVEIFGEGWGSLNSKTLNSPYESAEDWVNSIYQEGYWKDVVNKKEWIKANHFTDFFDTLQKLSSKIPSKRYFCHRDFGFNNTLSDGEKITGIIDWAEAGYGDFLYDIAWLQVYGGWQIDYKSKYYSWANQSSTIDLSDYDTRIKVNMLNILLDSLYYFALSEDIEGYNFSLKTLYQL